MTPCWGVSRGHDRRSWGILAGHFRRRIDPHGRGQGFAARRPLHEALGMGGVGREARVVTDLKDRGRAPIVDVGGREIAQATVVMRVVVPREEIVADRARVFDGTEAVRKVRAVFDRPELGFGKGIVVAHPRPRVARLDAEIREQQRDELAAHRRAAVRVDRELLRTDVLLAARRLDQALGQVGVLVECERNLVGN